MSRTFDDLDLGMTTLIGAISLSLGVGCLTEAGYGFLTFGILNVAYALAVLRTGKR